MKKYPCKGCTERAAGCHATCEKYTAAKAKWDAEQAKIRADRRVTADLGEMNTASMKRNRCLLSDRKW